MNRVIGYGSRLKFISSLDTKKFAGSLKTLSIDLCDVFMIEVRSNTKNPMTEADMTFKIASPAGQSYEAEWNGVGIEASEAIEKAWRKKEYNDKIIVEKIY